MMRGSIMKCIVKGCAKTTTVEGDWLCPDCFVCICTGSITGDGHTFIHDLRDELLMAAAMAERAESLSVIEILFEPWTSPVSR
jgi:hypothetical protein